MLCTTEGCCRRLGAKQHLFLGLDFQNRSLLHIHSELVPKHLPFEDDLDNWQDNLDLDKTARFLTVEYKPDIPLERL